MDRETAKRLFVSTLTQLDSLLAPDASMLDWWRNHAAQPPDDQDIDYDEMLDALGEHLWGCHDVLMAPVEVLDAIGASPGVTYHEAVLHRELSRVVDGIDLDEDMVPALREIFRKDQAGHHRPDVDRATFHAWLHKHVHEPEGIIDADMAE